LYNSSPLATTPVARRSVRDVKMTVMRTRLRVFILALAVVGTAHAQTDDALARQRAKIDALDARIVALLNERASVVREVGRVKQQAGLAIADPKRAEEVLQRIASKNRGPLPNANLRRIYERIIAEMTAFEASGLTSK
jgi:chorismate mutase-like protein